MTDHQTVLGINAGRNELNKVNPMVTKHKRIPATIENASKGRSSGRGRI
jgi:hypothetical protein